MAKEEKKAFILRIAPETLKLLEQWAADDFRSVNGQIEYLLNEAIKKSGRARPEKKSGDANDAPAE